MSSPDRFGELRRAAAQHGFRELAEHLDDPRVHALAGPGPGRARRRPSVIRLIAVLVAAVLPALWLGGTAVTALRVGANPATGAYAGSVSVWPPGTPGPPPPSGTADCNSPDVMCITANSGSRLDLDLNGKIIEGLGHSTAGITLHGDNNVIQHFSFTNCAANCIWVKGRNNTIQDNHAEQAYYDGDDIDCMRFFGDGTRILRNTCENILVGNDEHGAHLDCMQTWASDSSGGGSSNIVIQGNHCASPHFHQCVMAEGPDSTDGGGGGPGVSENWLIKDNYFECHAPGQTVKLDDIDHGEITGNNFAGSGNRAIYITELSDDWNVHDNILGSGYDSLT